MDFAVQEIDVKEIMSKTNLPIGDFAVNPYVGCYHACKYCYASFMKRFTNHPEPWGEFIDVKNRTPIRDRGQYAGKEAFFCSVTDPYQPRPVSAITSSNHRIFHRYLRISCSFRQNYNFSNFE